MSKISCDLLFCRVQKLAKISSKFYIDLAYLLRQYLRVLTHPIIHFLHFRHCIQFFSIYLKEKFLGPNGGGLTPKTPLPTPLYVCVCMYACVCGCVEESYRYACVCLSVCVSSS